MLTIIAPLPQLLNQQGHGRMSERPEQFFKLYPLSLFVGERPN